MTSWPCGLAAAATWDRALVHTWARALGKEFKAKGANMILGPSVNVHRVATNGRNAEYLSGEELCRARVEQSSQHDTRSG